MADRTWRNAASEKLGKGKAAQSPGPHSSGSELPAPQSPRYGREGVESSILSKAIGQSEPLSPVAFAARFESAWQPLWCIAAAVLGNRAGADDVLQEAAMVAIGKLAQFDPESNFMAWMGKIVRFTALNHARRYKQAVAGRATGKIENVDPRSLEGTIVSRPEAFDLRGVVNGRGELIAQAGQEEFDDRMLAALNTLDETARACLLLRALLEMPYREISLALDIAEGTAMSHVHRARAAMRSRLFPETKAAGSMEESPPRRFKGGRGRDKGVHYE